MPLQSADGPNRPDRSKISQPVKKSSSSVLKILLAVFGCGFLVFACCVGWFGYNVYQGAQQAIEQARLNQGNNAVNAPRNQSGEAAFKAANSQIGVKSGNAARGNSEAAINLASEYATTIRSLREAFFTQRKKKPLFSLSDGEFLTYCRLDDKACVFLVHVPDLRKFSKEAKADLADLAWATAQQVARANLDAPPPQLAVGVRGVMFYDRTMVGKLKTGDEGAGDGIESRQSGTGSEKLLFSFFKSDVVPAGTVIEETPAEEGMTEEDAPADEPEVDGGTDAK